MELSDAQREALRLGSDRRWLGAKETSVLGSAMAALERKGLAEIQFVDTPYRRQVYRLTPAGRKLHDQIVLDKAVETVAHKEALERLALVEFEEIERWTFRHPVLGRFRIVPVGQKWRIEVPFTMMRRFGVSRASLSRQLVYPSLKEAVDYLYKLGQTATTGAL